MISPAPDSTICTSQSYIIVATDRNTEELYKKQEAEIQALRTQLAGLNRVMSNTSRQVVVGVAFVVGLLIHVRFVGGLHV
jgi:hypothetical protein